MENREKANLQDIKIQGLLGQYLNLRAAQNAGTASTGHLDDDTLSAFTEGRLDSREARPVISHLVDCSFCRHVTSELVRLDLAFAETQDLPATAQSKQPSKVSEVLSGILSRIFGTGDSAVFAHEEPNKEEDESKEEEEQEKKD